MQKQLTLQEKVEQLFGDKTTREKLDLVVEKAAPTLMQVAKLQKEVERQLKNKDNPQLLRQYLLDMNGWYAAVTDVSAAANAVALLAEKEWEAAKGLRKIDVVEGIYNEGKKQAVGYADGAKYNYTKDELAIYTESKYIADKIGGVKKTIQNYIDSIRSINSSVMKELNR